MGIYDRDYYRREGYGYLASFTQRGRACKYLILANVIMFLLQVATLPRLSPEEYVQGPQSLGPITDWLDLNVAAVLHGQVWRLLSHAFLHSPYDLFHIVFNMVVLWWFGTDVEDLYGPREFLAFYLVSAVFAGVSFVVGSFLGVPGTHALGASGAVTAVLVLCALHYPSRVIWVFWLLPIPIWLFVLFSVGRDLYGLLISLRQPEMADNIAVAAHLGGAAFAYVYYKRQWRLSGLWPPLRSWWRQRSRPRLRVYRDEVHAPRVVAKTPAGGEVDEHLEAKLDAVLEKVAQHGQDSLTDKERQILFRASEVYKKKRT
jgi:membrane associated rhomboid family serine protease